MKVDNTLSSQTTVCCGWMVALGLRKNLLNQTGRYSHKSSLANILVPVGFQNRTKNFTSILLRLGMMNKFWSKVKVGAPDDCWEWQAAKSHKGYGLYMVAYKHWRAHRFAWTITNGKIPENLCVMHKCDNPPCVNPAHLSLGTVKDNNLDRINKNRDHNKNKTHCKRGHKYTKNNTYYYKNGARLCKACNRDRANACYARKKALSVR